MLQLLTQKLVVFLLWESMRHKWSKLIKKRFRLTRRSYRRRWTCTRICQQFKLNEWVQALRRWCYFHQPMSKNLYKSQIDANTAQSSQLALWTQSSFSKIKQRQAQIKTLESWKKSLLTTIMRMLRTTRLKKKKLTLKHLIRKHQDLQQNQIKSYKREKLKNSQAITQWPGKQKEWKLLIAHLLTCSQNKEILQL